MTVEYINNILLQIKKDIQYNQLNGYKNLLYLYYNILKSQNTDLLNLFNLFIYNLFDLNIIQEENLEEKRSAFLSSKCYSQDKINYKQKLYDEKIIPSGLRRFEEC